MNCIYLYNQQICIRIRWAAWHTLSPTKSQHYFLSSYSSLFFYPYSFVSPIHSILSHSNSSPIYLASCVRISYLIFIPNLVRFHFASDHHLFGCLFYPLPHPHAFFDSDARQNIPGTVTAFTHPYPSSLIPYPPSLIPHLSSLNRKGTIQEPLPNLSPLIARPFFTSSLFCNPGISQQQVPPVPLQEKPEPKLW